MDPDAIKKMALAVPPPRSFGQPAPAGSSTHQPVAGRRSSRERPAAFLRPEGNSSKQQQQRRNKVLQNANQRIPVKQPHGQSPAKIGSSASATSLAGAQIVAGAGKRMLSAGMQSGHGEVQTHDTSAPMGDDGAVPLSPTGRMLKEHLVSADRPGGASEDTVADRMKAAEVPPLMLMSNDLVNFDLSSGQVGESRESSKQVGESRESSKETNNFRISSSLNSSSSAPALVAQTPAFGSPPKFGLPTLPESDNQAQRISRQSESSNQAHRISAQSGSANTDTRVAALEMELRLVQNRLSAEVRARHAADEVIADRDGQRRLLELQLHESRSENRQLRRTAEEAEERALRNFHAAEDLKERLRCLESTNEYRVQRERGRAAVIARLEGVLPKHILLKALA